MKDKLKRLQALALALVIIVSELMFMSIFNFNWHAIGITLIVNMVVVIYILEYILNNKR